MLENELFAFLEGTTDAAFSVSEQGEILSWNGAAERLFGYSSSEVLGKSCFQILHGRGVLGTQVCHEGCSVLEYTAGKGGCPEFRPPGQPAFREAAMGQLVHSGVEKPAEPTPSSSSSGT